MLLSNITLIVFAVFLYYQAVLSTVEVSWQYE